MKQLFTYFFSLTLSISPILSFAQDEHVEEQDKNKTSIRLGISVDYGKLFTIPSKFETKAEGGFDLIIKGKFQFLGEIGYADLNPQDAIKNGSYNSKGIYYRGGLAFGGEILPKNFLSLGVLYGFSNFEDSGTIVIRSTLWEDFDSTFDRKNISATWYEIVLITEQHIKNNIALGAKFRLRIFNNLDKDYIPEVLAVPGYGRTFNNSIPAFNLYVKFLISL